MSSCYRFLIPLTLIAAALGLQRAVAQPVLTAENSVPAFLGAEVSLAEFSATSPGDVAAVLSETGENVTWDISAFNFSDPLLATLEYREPPFDDLPGWTVFQNADPNPNFVNIIVDIFDPEFPDSVEMALYSFADSEQLLTYGFAAEFDVDEDGTVDEVVIANDPPELEFDYPVAFGDEWMTEVTSQFIVVGVAQFPGSTTTRNSSVTGWGTLVTPEGSVEVLQIMEAYTVSVFGIVAGSGTDYEFIGPFLNGTGKNAAVRSITARVSLNADGDAVDAGFTVGETEGGGPTSAEELSEIPGRFEIHENYPNPFNPATVIEYSVSSAGPATMTVHDILGRQVGVVFDGVVAAGRHQARWQAGALPSGIYQVRMAMDGEARTRSIVLQK